MHQHGAVVQRRGHGAAARVRVPNGDAANGARRPHLGIAALGDGALNDELGALARPSANTTSRATPAPRAIRSHGIELRADRGRLRGARLSRGGTGLNLARHDGFDLGWKLAWVVRDRAGPDLVDTYEAERRPLVEHTAARSAGPRGSIRTVEHEVDTDLGGRIRHVWSDGDSTLDLLTTGRTLFTGRANSGLEGAAAALASRVPVEVRPLDPIADRAVGAAGDFAVLVRPDWKPAAVLPGAAEPAVALRREVHALATRVLSRPLAGRGRLATSAPGRHATGWRA
jgi:hypothetical protein